MYGNDSNGSYKYKTHEFVAHSTEVNCVAIGGKSSQVLASGGDDNKVNVWRVGNASNVWTLGSNKKPIECLCFDSDELNVVSGSLNGSKFCVNSDIGATIINGGNPN